jgi:hypothetical protein
MSCFALITVFILLNKARKTEKKHAKQYKDFINLAEKRIELTNLIPIECLIEISKVLEHGAKKYSPNGWKTFVPPNGTPVRDWYFEKSAGHVEKLPLCKYEKESGCHHLSHAIANLMFAYWHDIQETQRLKFTGKNSQN